MKHIFFYLSTEWLWQMQSSLIITISKLYKENPRKQRNRVHLCNRKNLERTTKTKESTNQGENTNIYLREKKINICKKHNTRINKKIKNKEMNLYDTTFQVIMNTKMNWN